MKSFGFLDARITFGQICAAITVALILGALVAIASAMFSCSGSSGQRVDTASSMTQAALHAATEAPLDPKDPAALATAAARAGAAASAAATQAGDATAARNTSIGAAIAQAVALAFTVFLKRRKPAPSSTTG